MFPVKDNIPNRRVPVVTALLILVNAIVYLLAILHGGGIFSGPDLHEIEKYGLIPHALTHAGGHHPPGTRIPAWETVFSSMFVHASILHLGGNMLFLWIFGNTVEDAFGRVGFLVLYLLAGVVTVGVHVVLEPNATAPTLGASGAVAGVIGAHLMLYPRGQVLTVVLLVLFFTVVELPTWLMLFVWLALQAVFAATNLTTPAGGADAVAYVAHIGGLAFGLIVAGVLAARLRRAPKAA